MIFQFIEIHNLFSYYGKQTLDLRGATENKNIVLISGRNGYGKTSFLNSMKLLFTGVNDNLREAVQRGRKPSPKQYVRGDGDNWFGIMNKQASNEGQVQCSITARWQESRGTVTLSRSWDLSNDGYRDDLRLTTDFLTNELSEDEIKRFIDERIPASFLPFYFFDGEQVQTLAEANRNTQMQHIEQLLNISRIESLDDALKQAINQWRKNSMSAEEVAKLNELTHKKGSIEQRLLAYKEKLKELDTKKDDVDYVLDGIGLKKRRYTIQYVEGEKNKAELSTSKKSCEKSIEEKQDEITKTLPRFLPLFANQTLLKTLQTELETQLKQQQSNSLEEVKVFFKQLPVDLFNTLPPKETERLSEPQKTFYSAILDELCTNYLSDHTSQPTTCFPTLRKHEAIALQKICNAHGDNQRQQSIRQLQALQQERTQLTTLETNLDNLVQLSPEDREQYSQLLEQEDALKIDYIDIESEKKKVEADMEQSTQSIHDLEGEIKQQQEAVRLSHNRQQRKIMAEKMKDFFRDYKQKLKEEKRASIETAINQYMTVLMTSHHLISRITIDEGFGLHYWDKKDTAVAMGSISAGMKQLVATALLWALKDVSAKDIPMIIDTPLARIDMNHQYQLLSEYYPKVAKQVILLPTNSEIDPSKYKKLKPYIYQEYCLSNAEGNHTSFQKRPMWNI
jgi:DNA sulfur modification protein DndD